MEIEVFNAKNSKSYGKCSVYSDITISELAAVIHHHLKSTPKPARQSLRLEPHGKALKGTETLRQLETQRIYIKDLGPQIGWKTVFILEYAGPLLIYLIFYARPELIYGSDVKGPMCLTAHIAAACFILHYVKRLLETLCVHRFSHNTMPLMNLFKNCAYYWGFTAYVAFHVNHPLFVSPNELQLWLSLAAFMLCEVGNFSVHIALRNLRPAGTNVRQIPVPDDNPFTALFNLVSCPNYTYEIGAWLSFSFMTSCLASLLFTLAGAYQMTVWALAKHRNYRNEFSKYPKGRRAIFPYVL